MSITVAANAADNTNGSQVVCQSTQHNHCGEYNGDGGGDNDDDDMAVFDHEKEQHKQFEIDCRNHVNQKDKESHYEFRDFIRSKDLNVDNEIQNWEVKWSSLMAYIRGIYRMAMDGVEIEHYPPHNVFKEAAYESKTCDSYHVFQNVESLVMDIVLEAGARQVKILKNDEGENRETPEMPLVFIFGLLDSYRRLMAATDHLKDVIKPIEEYHLSKFNLSWRMMNQYLYHSRLYADRTIYNLVTTFIEQILSTPILSKSLLSASLICDYTRFVDEVKLNISEWADARTCIHNIKCNEWAMKHGNETWAIGVNKYKESLLKEENILYPPSPPSIDELVLGLTIPTPPQSPAPEYRERVENDDDEEVDDDGGSNYCDCKHDNTTGDSQQNSTVDIDHHAYNGKCLNGKESLMSTNLPSIFSYDNMKERMLCFYSSETLSDEDEKLIAKHLGKKVLNSDGQIKSKSLVNVKCISTTVEKNVTCKVELDQLPKRRYPYPQVNKSTESGSKLNNRPIHGYSCHKHTEHVKRMHHHDETSECSSGRSSQDDSCSERSTSSPRQCDCCYCEVFGHGAPSVAPVSRNYQEMRDRLRNLYLLRKAKQNILPTNDSTQQKDPNVHKPLSNHPSNQLPQSIAKCDDIKGVQQQQKEAISFDDYRKLKLKNNKEGLFDKPIDELVNFIEGNKAVNEKRAAKKARRREKKEEMERIKEEEEAERKRIEEEERKKQEMDRLKREEILKKERKKGKNQNKPQKQIQHQNQIKNSKTQKMTKQQVQVQQNTQSSKKKKKQTQGKENILTKKDEKCKNNNNNNVEGAKMVTIKRDSDSSKVTITFRGAVEDDVLCTLYDNEAIKAIQRLCDKSKQPQEQIEEKTTKKRSRNRKKKQAEQTETQVHPKPVESVLITNKNAPKLPTNMKWYYSPDVNITPVPSSTNSIQSQPNTVLIKRTNNNQVFTRPLPPPQLMPLTSPTAIQINEAVNKISASSAPIDIDKLQLPPGITITKLDPSDYKPPRDIQQSTEKPKQTPLQFPFASSATVTPFTMQQNVQNNVVVKTDGYNYEGETEWSGAASKRNRRRKKINGCNLDNINSENIQPGFTITNKSSTRDPCNEEGKTIAGQIPTNTPRSMPLPVIIQRHGGMVTIRNPLYQRNDDAILTETNDPQVGGGDDDDANPSGKRRRRRRRVKGGSKQTDVEESVFEPKDIDLEDGEMDADERELEAFKRFCLQSVPPQRKEKVHLNIKDIVLKKKSTASAAAAAAVGLVMDSVRVAIRVRPLVKSELDRGCSNCVLADSINQQIIVNNNANQTFTFNYVFTSEHSQNQVYKLAVEDLVQKLFSGYNVTILAYGQTGSGKTHSMGTNFMDDDNEEEKGIIPRSIQYIFNEVKKKEEQAMFSIKASFIELYQEQVYDLLSPNKATLDIREDGRGICIPGLTEISVTDFSSTLQCLIQGSSVRATGATAMNAQSSRSHCIFTLTISQMQEDGNNITAKFHLVDLAGSERSKKTKATGERFKEGVNINKGLLSLGNVITSLCEKSAHISYRDSKLTRLLQDSLGGNSVTLMIACISPADYNMDETVSTLRYANRALQIKNKPVINQDPTTAQISALSKENHELKLKIIAMETNGIVNCPPEHNALQKSNKDLQEKIRAMSQVLSEYMTQSASLNMKALLAETGRDTMKKNLEELKIEFENALKFNKLEELKNIQQKINSILDEHNRTEVEISSDDYVTATEDIEDVSESDNETDRTKEQMVMETIQLNRELNKLNKELAMKEHLAAKLIESVSHIGEYCPEENTEELKNKLEQLKQERDSLEEALKLAQINNINSKLSEQRRKKLQELEQKIANLTKKCLEQDRIIKMKVKNDIKVENLNNEIKSIKVMKVKLIQQMKSENEKFRQFKLERDRELCRLKENERKQKNQMIRMERLHVRQQAALKRKLEDAANVNKRLKDALAVRKAIEAKRDEAFMPKAQRIQKWVNEELDVLMSTVDAEKTLEQLEVDRETIYKMMQRCEDQLETTGLTDEFKHSLKMDKREMSEELQLRSAQIMELRQKIFDSNEELMKKTRFDHLTTIADTKIALKHIFHVAADNRRATLELQNQIEELKTNLLEGKEVVKAEEKKFLDIMNKNQEHIQQLQKEYEDNILVLLRQLNEKEKISNGGNGNEFTERFRIYDDQLSEFEQLREELSKKDKLILDLQAVVNSNSYHSKINNMHSPLTPTKKIDETKENNVDITPLRRRLDKLKRESRMIEHSEERVNRLNLKRNAVGQPMCLCIKNCLKNICMCQKKNMSCSKYCKCSAAVCTNRHLPITEEDPSADECVLNQTFKKPKFVKC